MQYNEKNNDGIQLTNQLLYKSYFCLFKLYLLFIAWDLFYNIDYGTHKGINCYSQAINFPNDSSR